MKTETASPHKQSSEEYDRFTGFMRKLVSVPRSTIQERLKEEKAAKASSSPAPGASGA